MRRPLAAALLALLCSAACSDGGGGATPPEPGPRALNESVWPMHPIANRYRGANSLGPGDADGDGLRDYVTNYEFDQRYMLALHPGPGTDPRLPWPAATAWSPRPLASGSGVNPENAAMEDLDGDGRIDVVAAQGWSALPFWEGSQPGVRVVWGPDPADLLDQDAWTDGGRIPETVDRGHMIFVAPRDVNEDGALDILAGGRVHGGNFRKGGLVWIEAPLARAERRDLSKWRVRDIDPAQFSGHGFTVADVDGDGDFDLADANADFDTPQEEEEVVWYENPGAGTDAQRRPWPKHVVYRGSEFYGKPQVAVADLDGDGLADLVTQVRDALYWFRAVSAAPTEFERIVIPKPPETRWIGRTVRVADLDGDGRLDIVGMLLHEYGDLPGDKASVYWMSYEGDAPRADNWRTRAMKRGPGRTMLLGIFGEKWDQADATDVDGDGDLDVVANCEEWWEDDIEFRAFWDWRASPESAAVVWFENRLNEAPYAFEERGGLAAMEAEHFTDLLDGTWSKRAGRPGFAGDGYLQDGFTLSPYGKSWAESRGAVYRVRVRGGEYRLWLRRLVPRQWGYGLGGTESDSAWVSANGAEPETFLDAGGPSEEWAWVPAGAFALPEGESVLSLRVREGGFAADRLLLAADPAYVPEGAGPPETPAR